MGFPNGSSASGLKRNLNGYCSEVPCKVAHVGTEHKHEPILCGYAHSCHCCCMKHTIAESCSNYLNSGLPDRIMFYNHGEWVDFSKPVVEFLTRVFMEKASVVFAMSGQPLVLDFLSMVLINFRTRKQRSVAWIDTGGNCFFPTICFDDEAEESTDGILGNKGSSPMGLENGKASEIIPELVKRVVVDNRVPLEHQLPFSLDILRKKVEKLERGSSDFFFVQNVFLSGMEPFASLQSIMSIHKVVQNDNGARMRRERFEKQMRATREKRGDANLRFAWYGSSKIDIVGILIYGFGVAGKPTEGAAFGTGIYLTPKSHAFSSVNFCDNDDNGVQYMLLCRVVLGNLEQVQPGSNQYLPSSAEYDSGVDNLQGAKCFVVWPTHIDSYIHPEYLVSFRLSPAARKYFSELHDVRFHVPNSGFRQIPPALHLAELEPKEAPVSPWVPFTTLLKAVKDHISPEAMELLYHHREEMRAKKVSRKELVTKFRLIVGDELLVPILRRFQRSPALWYKSSNSQNPKPDECSSQLAANRDAQKIEPGVPSATRPDGSYAPEIDLDNAEGATSNELHELPAMPMEHSDTSKSSSATPTMTST